MEIFIQSNDYGNENAAKLHSTLCRFKGIDPVFLMVKQTDGRVFKADLKCSVDSHNEILQRQIIDIFGENCLVPARTDFSF
ncbi:MAG: hypothetical protein HUJ51_05280 [Eggerthellaceae bacterium]|nr:hypothetical protein [Eggerthellaceae bacterium]